MRILSPIGACGLLLAMGTFLSAEELQSGIKVDGKIGAYKSTKVGGADDGIKNGKSLCYT